VLLERWHANARISTYHRKKTYGSSSEQARIGMCRKLAIPPLLRLEQMASPWEHLSSELVGELMAHLKWDRGVSAVFRQTCKGWRDAHDQSVVRLSVRVPFLPSRFELRTMFPRVNEIKVHMHSGPISVTTSSCDEKWLWTLAGLTSLTSLNLGGCKQASDGGLRALAGLTALISLDLGHCRKVSDNGLQALANLSALTSLDLGHCREVSDNGFRALASLTSLTSLNLGRCREVSDIGWHALADLTALISLDLGRCRELSDTGSHALTGLTALTSLNLIWCEEVTASGLHALLACLTALTYLNLFHCERVSAAVGSRTLDSLTALSTAGGLTAGVVGCSYMTRHATISAVVEVVGWVEALPSTAHLSTTQCFEKWSACSAPSIGAVD